MAPFLWPLECSFRYTPSTHQSREFWFLLCMHSFQRKKRKPVFAFWAASTSNFLNEHHWTFFRLTNMTFRALPNHKKTPKPPFFSEPDSWWGEVSETIKGVHQTPNWFPLWLLTNKSFFVAKKIQNSLTTFWVPMHIELKKKTAHKQILLAKLSKHFQKYSCIFADIFVIFWKSHLLERILDPPLPVKTLSRCPGLVFQNYLLIFRPITRKGNDQHASYSTLRWKPLMCSCLRSPCNFFAFLMKEYNEWICALFDIMRLERWTLFFLISNFHLFTLVVFLDRSRSGCSGLPWTLLIPDRKSFVFPWLRNPTLTATETGSD